jgi:hypothetical protein
LAAGFVKYSLRKVSYILQNVKYILHIYFDHAGNLLKAIDLPVRTFNPGNINLNRHFQMIKEMNRNDVFYVSRIGW